MYTLLLDFVQEIIVYNLWVGRFYRVIYCTCSSGVVFCVVQVGRVCTGKKLESSKSGWFFLLELCRDLGRA